MVSTNKHFYVLSVARPSPFAELWRDKPASVVRHRAINDRNRRPVSGNVEVTEVQVSFMAAGRVLERLADEGPSVKNGDRVARLDRVEREQVLEPVRATLAVAT